MSRPRAIPVATLAFAYELRQEYQSSWKLIARALGYDHQALCDAVNHAIEHGVSNG